MKRTNFSGLNSQQKQKKTLNLNGFKGVDYIITEPNNLSMGIIIVCQFW